MPISAPVGGTLAEAASGTSVAVPYPAGIVAGDLLIVWTVSSVGTLPVSPAGWTDMGGGASGSGGQSPAQRVSCKYATGSESGSLTVTMPSGASKGKMWRVSGVDPTTPIDAASVHTLFGAVSNFGMPGITTTMPGVLLMAFGAVNGQTGQFFEPTTQGGAWTEDFDDQTPTPRSGAIYLIWSGSGATGAIDWNQGAASTRGGALLVAVRPVAGSPPAASDAYWGIPI